MEDYEELKKERDGLIDKVSRLKESLEISSEETRTWIYKACEAVSKSKKAEAAQLDLALEYERKFSAPLYKRVLYAVKMVFGVKS